MEVYSCVKYIHFMLLFLRFNDGLFYDLDSCLPNQLRARLTDLYLDDFTSTLQEDEKIRGAHIHIKTIQLSFTPFAPCLLTYLPK